MNSATDSRRAKVDVINFWCVAVLIISAASVAGVVGAAVVSGEFEDRNFDLDNDDELTEAGVLTETNPDGTTRVRWSEEGQARSLEIRVDDEVVDSLTFVGDETIVESGTFDVVAVYDDDAERTIESRG